MSVHKKSGIPGFDPIRDELVAEVERLRTENDRMREMFREAGISDENVEHALNARPAGEVLAPYLRLEGSSES